MQIRKLLKKSYSSKEIEKIEIKETIEEYNAEYGTNFTEDMVDENGDVCVGGFGDDYGDFQDFDAIDFNYNPNSKPTNCVNCGAPLTSYKCEYCGTYY